MEYHGKLYGKIGNKHFDTCVTSKDFDRLKKEQSEMLEMLKELVLAFEERTLDVSQFDKAKQLIKQATT